ncbi:response regulator [Aquipuribacter sp. MA13-6]|uniref:response regulator n=1 Tax=unclassified Aquipuribacter TaxID=2635084 RepID=UPI003EED2214
MSTRRVTVMVVDDHEVVRRGVVEVCDAAPGLEVVAEAASVAEAIRRGPAVRPDVALVDLDLPDGTGVDVMRGLRLTTPGTRFVVLSGVVEAEEAAESLAAAGAGGFVAKTMRGSHIVETVLAVAAGRAPFEELTRPEPVSWTDPLAVLTPAERSVLLGIGEGLSNREIGERLGSAEQTVKNHVRSVLSKLGFRRRSQVAAWVAADGAATVRSAVPMPRSGPAGDLSPRRG